MLYYFHHTCPNKVNCTYLFPSSFVFSRLLSHPLAKNGFRCVAVSTQGCISGTKLHNIFFSSSVKLLCPARDVTDSMEMALIPQEAFLMLYKNTGCSDKGANLIPIVIHSNVAISLSFPAQLSTHAPWRRELQQRNQRLSRQGCWLVTDAHREAEAGGSRR